MGIMFYRNNIPDSTGCNQSALKLCAYRDRPSMPIMEERHVFLYRWAHVRWQSTLAPKTRGKMREVNNQDRTLVTKTNCDQVEIFQELKTRIDSTICEINLVEFAQFPQDRCNFIWHCRFGMVGCDWCQSAVKVQKQNNGRDKRLTPKKESSGFHMVR